MFITETPVHNICVLSLLEQKVLYTFLVVLMAHKPGNEQNLRKRVFG